MTAILRPPFFSALRNANAKVLDLQREVSQRHSDSSNKRIELFGDVRGRVIPVMCMSTRADAHF